LNDCGHVECVASDAMRVMRGEPEEERLVLGAFLNGLHPGGVAAAIAGTVAVAHEIEGLGSEVEALWQRIGKLQVKDTAGMNRLKVCSIGSARRGERRNHAVARAVSRPSSISSSDCTASGTLLSSASTSYHSAT